MNYQPLPPGAKPILQQGNDGRMYPTGFASLPNGNTCRCQTPANWVAQTPDRYNPRAFVMLPPAAQADAAAQVAAGAGRIGNTFQLVDLPNRGANGVARVDGVTDPTSENYTYSLVLDNTLGATQATVIIGDYPGTLALDGISQSLPAGFVVGGEFGTSSLAQINGRTFARPWTVKRIQFVASNQLFFSGSNVFYYDTPPNSNNYTKSNLSLSQLLTADQYNPTIQYYERGAYLDGVNGFILYIPNGYKLTLQFTIQSEQKAGMQVLVGAGKGA